MPALLFPTPDVLRLALASGAVPPHVTDAPCRAGRDGQGRVWLDPGRPVEGEALTFLTRLGVLIVPGDVPGGGAVGCWAELLPLREAAGGETPARLLVELPDRSLARFTALLDRLGREAARVRLLGETPGRSWVLVTQPDGAVLHHAGRAEAGFEAFVEQTPGVWVLRGWEHPLPGRLVVSTGQTLLLRTPYAVTLHPFPVPTRPASGFCLPAVPARLPSVRERPLVPVRPVLARQPDTPLEAFWVFGGAAVDEFWGFVRAADERLVGRFEAALAGDRLLVRVRGKVLPQMPFRGVGYYPAPQAPGLFLPAGRVLRPSLRPVALARLFGLGTDRVTWLEPDGESRPVVHSAPAAGFRPLAECLEYIAPPAVGLDVPGLVRAEPFALGRFALREEPIIPPEEVGPPARPAPAAPAAGKPPGWLARALERFAGRLRRPGPGVERAAPGVGVPVRQDAGERGPRRSAPVRKVVTADALLHGRQRAARRHELEGRVLAEVPRLDPDRRAARWAELAEVYAATGNPADAAVCWINAAWEVDRPPDGWLERWFVAECRAARQTDPGVSLDRLLGTTGRFGTVRAVAAFAVWGSFQSPPPAELVAALPRVISFLDHHFDDLPARAAWLARVAVTRLCDGDGLGLARWRDRVLARLRDRGPALDLDAPSFLRFHGTASADRFRVAREWLTAAHAPIFRWVRGLGSGGRLQWAGIDAETDCTEAYAQMLLAWGLGCLGERARSRDGAGRARKALGRAAGPGVDPAVPALLGDLFLHRIRDAQEGRPPRPGLPPELLARFDRLPEFSRYAVDRLREHLRVLEPAGGVRAFRGRDRRELRGDDRLGERLRLLIERTDPGHLADETDELLAVCDADPSAATLPRVVFTLLEVAPHLPPPALTRLLARVVPALGLLPAALPGGRPERLADYLGVMLGTTFRVAARLERPDALRPVVDHLLAGGSDAAVRAALGRVAGPVFRSLRKLGFAAECEALLRLLDPSAGGWPAGSPFPPSRLGLAVGWFAAGDDEAGTRILDETRERLFLAGPGGEPGRTELADRTELAVAYAGALGFAPPGIALGRLGEIFQRLTRVSVTGSTNRYYTLKPLELIDAVVRAVVTEDFALGPAVRGWLDDDEFLIRRRVHRDLAAVLRAEGLS